MSVACHPDHTYVLTYPGGYCGEFLCHWLGQHVGCVPVPTVQLSNNRYTTNFNQIRIHPRAPALKLFLPGHDTQTYSAKNKFVPTDISRVIGVHASVPFQKFYFVLFVSKTVLFKYNKTAPLVSVAPSIMAQFLDSIHPQTEFYHHEFDAWQSNQPVPSIDQVLQQRFQQACIVTDVDTVNFDTDGFNINLDLLFFGSSADQAIEYQRLCDHIDTVPDTALLHQLAQYHARNLELVSNVVNMPVLDFVALSNDQAKSLMLEAFQRLV